MGFLTNNHRKVFKDTSDRGTSRNLFKKVKITHFNGKRVWAFLGVRSKILVQASIFIEGQ